MTKAQKEKLLTLCKIPINWDSVKIGSFSFQRKENGETFVIYNGHCVAYCNLPITGIFNSPVFYTDSLSKNRATRLKHYFNFLIRSIKDHIINNYLMDDEED